VRIAFAAGISQRWPTPRLFVRGDFLSGPKRQIDREMGTAVAAKAWNDYNQRLEKPDADTPDLFSPSFLLYYSYKTLAYAPMEFPSYGPLIYLPSTDFFHYCSNKRAALGNLLAYRLNLRPRIINSREFISKSENLILMFDKPLPF
jgi:hypothetical protein